MAAKLLEAGFLLMLALLVPSSQATELLQCIEPNGSRYIGISPPANCVPLVKGRATPGRDAGSSRKTDELRPTPRPNPPAVVLQSMSKLTHDEGLFAEGSVANGASFPVYNVRICIDEFCDYTSPSTIEPGATAAFAVPANPNSLEG